MKQEEFLFEKVQDNLPEVKKILQILSPYFIGLQTFMDLGCGMCEWSKGFKDIGFIEGTLVDHPSSPMAKNLTDKSLTFVSIDLDKHLPPQKKYDVIICTEVLEHFKESRAKDIGNFLASNTDCLLFSAAVPGQGGIGHLNEQRHHYWHEFFLSHDFLYFDGFKNDIIHDKKIPFYYRQNLFIYHRGHMSQRFSNLKNYTSGDMEIIFSSILQTPITLKQIVNGFVPAMYRFISSLPRRLKMLTS